MKVLIILQGAPGSGKSTEAEHLKKTLGAVICSTDTFSYNEYGQYEFNPKLLEERHRKCRELCNFYMGWDMPWIVLDNTNIKGSNIEPYIHLAEKHGYKIQVRRFTDEYENQHGVPKEKVEKMKTAMEDLESFIPEHLLDKNFYWQDGIVAIRKEKS